MHGVVAPKATNISLMAAGITAGVADSSADLLIDLKSGCVLGANPRKQFLGQFSGIFIGGLAAWAYGKFRAKEADIYTFPVAAGIIAGESLMGIFLILLPLIVAFFAGNL